MASYTEVRRWRLGDGEAVLEFNYELPPGWDGARWEAGDPSDPAPSDGLTIHWVRVANSSSDYSCRIEVLDGRGRQFENRTLGPGQSFQKNAPLGAVKEMADLPGYVFVPIPGVP